MASEIQRWLSVKIQRALALPPQDAVEIVKNISALEDAQQIETALTGWLGTDDVATEVIDEYFKKMSIPRVAHNQATPTKPTSGRPPSYAEASGAQPRPIPALTGTVYQKGEQEEDDDMGYGELVKHKKKRDRGGNREKYTVINQAVNMPVMIKSKKKGKNAHEPIKLIEKVRAICGCQARLHEFVNNCLRCGRIVCLQEDAGPCFYCGHMVTTQGVPQLSPFFSANGDPTGEKKSQPILSERQKAGLQVAQANLARLLDFDKTNAERTTVYDDQADYFDMNNRWISADERKKLAQKEAAIIKAKTNRNSTLTIDFGGRTVVTDAPDESHIKFKEQMIAEVEAEMKYAKMMAREEAEEHLKNELERIKPSIKKRPDGSIFVVPTMEIPVPEFVSRQRNAASSYLSQVSNSNRSNTYVSTDPSPSSSYSSSNSSRLQTDFFPEVEIGSSDSKSEEAIEIKQEHVSKDCIKYRGIVEGFSGGTWDQRDRDVMIDWMAKQGGNFYLWAPHEDPMFRRLWNILMSSEEVEIYKQTIDKCNKLGIEFNMAIQPRSIDFRSDIHRDSLARKLLQLYTQCGCKSFTFHFGNTDRATPPGCRSLATAHYELINATIQVMEAFIDLKYAPVPLVEVNSSPSVPCTTKSESEGLALIESKKDELHWFVIPAYKTCSFETGKDVQATNYLREMHQKMNTKVTMIWSGPETPVTTLNESHLQAASKFFTARKLFLWDLVPQLDIPFNIPQHSIETFEYTAATFQYFDIYNGICSTISTYTQGLLLSSMHQAIPSRITISTALTFARSPSDYNPTAIKLVEVMQAHLFDQDSKDVAAVLKSLLDLAPHSPRSTRQKGLPAHINSGTQNEKSSIEGMATLCNGFLNSDYGFKGQFYPTTSLLREFIKMNTAYFEYSKNSKLAGQVTIAIRNLISILIPVLYSDHDLTSYRNWLFSFNISDKSFKGDIQRAYSKWKAHFQAGIRESSHSIEYKETYTRLATEATISLRELEVHLITEYMKEDIVSWRVFLNNLLFRNPNKPFLLKLPTMISVASAQPNSKVIDQRSARVKLRLAEEEKQRNVALKFAIASGIVQPPAPAAPLAQSNVSYEKKILSREEVKGIPVPGLRYFKEFITPEAEANLIQAIDHQSWDQNTISRKIQQYGFVFQYKAPDGVAWDDPRLEIGPFFPAWLKELGEDIYKFKVVPNKFDQAIINEYTPGQGIRAHVDNPAGYEDGIISLSLGTSAVMEFAHEKSGQKYSLFLEPRSLVVLTNDSRWEWSHAIDAKKEDTWEGKTIPRGRRISITLRKVKTAVSKSLYNAATKKK